MARVEKTDVLVDAADGLVLLFEHAAPDDLVLQVILDYKLVHFLDEEIRARFQVNAVQNILWTSLKEIFEQVESTRLIISQLVHAISKVVVDLSLERR